MVTCNHIFIAWFCCISSAMHVAWPTIDIHCMVHDGQKIGKENRKDGIYTEGKTEERNLTIHVLC